MGKGKVRIRWLIKLSVTLREKWCQMVIELVDEPKSYETTPQTSNFSATECKNAWKWCKQTHGVREKKRVLRLCVRKKDDVKKWVEGWKLYCALTDLWYLSINHPPPLHPGVLFLCFYFPPHFSKLNLQCVCRKHELLKLPKGKAVPYLFISHTGIELNLKKGGE